MKRTSFVIDSYVSRAALKNCLLCVLVLLSASPAFPQAKIFSYTSQTSIDFRLPAQGFLTHLPKPKPGVVGSYYVYDEKYHADIYLKDSTKLADLNVKLNLNDRTVEIDHNGDTKVLPFKLMLGLVLKRSGATEEFINGDLLPGADNFNRGALVQVIYNGKVQLFCRVQQEIIKASANQNPMLDVGKKDDEIVVTRKYLIVHTDRVINASVSKPAFRSSMRELFGQKIDPLLKKCNNKNVADLINLVEQLDNKI